MKINFKNEYENSFFINYNNFNEETKEFIELAKKYPNKKVKFKEFVILVFIYETKLKRTKWYIIINANLKGKPLKDEVYKDLSSKKHLNEIVTPNLLDAWKMRFSK